MKLEINMVVKGAKESADYYKSLFGAKILSKTDLESELNEIQMEIGGVEIKVLNENADYGMIAPTSESVKSTWINLIVDDIKATIDKAVELECNIISPITEFPDSKAINAVFSDRYNHIWVINQKR